MTDQRQDDVQGSSHLEGDTLGNILFLVFRPRLTLALATTKRGDEYDLPDECILGDKHYRDVGYGGFADFCDWLRDPAGVLLGVRFWPYEEMAFLRTYLLHFSYVISNADGKALEVYLSSDRHVAEAQSEDQDFASNRVYSTAEGEWAIAVRASHLNTAEIRQLETADVDWIAAQMTVTR